MAPPAGLETIANVQSAQVGRCLCCGTYTKNTFCIMPASDEASAWRFASRVSHLAPRASAVLFFLLGTLSERRPCYKFSDKVCSYFATSSCAYYLRNHISEQLLAVGVKWHTESHIIETGVCQKLRWQWDLRGVFISAALVEQQHKASFVICVLL